MVEPSTVRRLLDMIETRLGRLVELSRVSLDQYVADASLQAQVERHFEVCIQACIDLGAHILADYPRVQPETYADVFRELEQLKIITPALSEKLQRMARFRNLLVHGYADIVAATVYANLSRLDDIRQFVKEVAPYLKAQGAL